MSKTAIRKIAKYAQGIPINLDMLSTDVLIYGHQAQKNPIPASIARRVIADFENNRRSLRVVWFGLASLILLASLVALWLYGDGWRVSAWLPAALLPEQMVTTSADRHAVAGDRTQGLPPALPIYQEVPVATPPSTALVGPSAEVIQEVGTLVHQFFPDGGDFGLQVWPDKGTDAVYAVGEKLLVRIMAETDAYLQVDYYQADGQVVHLLPNPLDSNRVDAGQAFILGKPGSSFQFNISPPFGIEMLMVLASQRPLNMQRDVPSTEPASLYLARLAKNLEHYRAHEKVAVAYTRIYTQAKTP